MLNPKVKTRIFTVMLILGSLVSWCAMMALLLHGVRPDRAKGRTGFLADEIIHDPKLGSGMFRRLWRIRKPVRH